jgi:hypothetical protein
VRRCQRMEGASVRLIFRLPEPAKAKKISLNANCLALSNSTPILQRGVAVRFFPWFPWRRPHRNSKPSSRWKLREIACCSQIDSIRSMAAHWLLEQAARDFTTEPCHRTDRIRWESGGRCAGRYPACGASIEHHHELSSIASSQAHDRPAIPDPTPRYRIEDPQRELKCPARRARSSRVTSCVRRLRSCQAPVRTQNAGALASFLPWVRQSRGFTPNATNALHRCYSRATRGFPCQTNSKQCRRFRPTGPPGSQPWTLRATTSN